MSSFALKSAGKLITNCVLLLVLVLLSQSSGAFISQDFKSQPGRETINQAWISFKTVKQKPIKFRNSKDNPVVVTAYIEKEEEDETHNQREFSKKTIVISSLQNAPTLRLHAYNFPSQFFGNNPNFPIHKRLSLLRIYRI